MKTISITALSGSLIDRETVRVEEGIRPPREVFNNADLVIRVDEDAGTAILLKNRTGPVVDLISENRALRVHLESTLEGLSRTKADAQWWKEKAFSDLTQTEELEAERAKTGDLTQALKEMSQNNHEVQSHLKSTLSDMQQYILDLHSVIRNSGVPETVHEDMRNIELSMLRDIGLPPVNVNARLEYVQRAGDRRTGDRRVKGEDNE